MKRRRRQNPDRSFGQTLALMVVAGVASSLLSALVFKLLASEDEARRSEPFLPPVAPGQGSA